MSKWSKERSPLYSRFRKIKNLKYKLNIMYSRPGKIDTGKVETFYEISRHFRKIKGRFFEKYDITIYGFLDNLYLGNYSLPGVSPGTRAFNKCFGTYMSENCLH